MSSKSDHLSRIAEVEDIERIEKSWTNFAQRDGLKIPKKAINELKKRIKQAATKDAKAKLDFVKCGLDDGLVMTLMEALATAPCISKIDLKGNQITNKSANFILRLLRGQLTLIRTVPIDDRLSAAFLGEFTIDGKEVSEEIKNEIQVISDILRQANAIAHIRKAYIDYGAPTVMNAMTVTELWTNIVGKPEKVDVKKAMDRRSSKEFVLNYSELESLLLDALVQKGICPKIPSWAGEKIGLKPPISPASTLAPAPAPAPAPVREPSPITIPKEKNDSPKETNISTSPKEQPKQTYVEKYELEDDVIEETLVENEEKLKSILTSVSSPTSYSNSNTDQKKTVRYVDTDLDQTYIPNVASPSSVNSSSSKKQSPNRHSYYGFGAEKRMSSATIESPTSLGSKSPKKSPKSEVDDNDAQEFIDKVLETACLDLNNQGVADLNIAEIFPESQLSAIQILILRQNSISKPESMGIMELSHLTNLDLSMNNIEGKFIENCLPHSLVNLDLSYNVLTDISGILCCINLKTLNVSNNRLKKIIGLPPLMEKVNLSDNQLTSPVTLRVISACPKIWAVGIAGNPLLNKIADWRAQLVSLCPKVIEIDGVLRPGYKLKVKEPKKEELPIPPKHTKKLTKKEQVERDRARINYHSEQRKIMDDMRLEYQANITAPVRYLNKESIDMLTNRLSEPLKPRGQNKRSTIKTISVKQAEIIVQNWLNSSSLEIGRAVAALTMVLNMRDTSGPIDADQLVYFNRALERVSFARDFVLEDDVDLAMSTLPDDNEHMEIIQSTAETLENMASFSAVLQSLEEVLSIPELTGEDLAPAVDAIMLSEYGVHINDNILTVFGTPYQPLESNLEEVQENQDEIIQSNMRDEKLETEMQNIKSLEDIKMRIQSRALIGGEEDQGEIIVNEPENNNNDDDPISLNDFQDLTHKDELGSIDSSISALSAKDIGDYTSNTNELNTKDRLKARIEEKRKLKEGSGNQ